MRVWIQDQHDRILSIGTAVAIAAGLALDVAGAESPADAVLAIAVAVMLLSRVLLVEHRLGVDMIALVAMAGALALGEYLAGAVIALMFAGGQALETAAA